MLQSVCLHLYTKVQFEIDCSFELCPCTSRAQGRPNMSVLYSCNRGPRLSLRCKPISEFNLCCRRPRCRTPGRRVVHLGRFLPVPNCSGASPSRLEACPSDVAVGASQNATKHHPSSLYARRRGGSNHEGKASEVT
jgi:hypothetical protein